jgi:alpha-mannosidase
MKQKRTLHVICQAHLDPVWIWPRRDGYSEALTTLGSAADFLECESDLCFTRSSAAIYRWVQHADPGLFERICSLVASGRWEVVNGWEVQPDCNLPLGESFVRQSLYGKRWFQNELGVDVTIGYNVDSFGHSGNLPQILVRSGMTHYVCMRPFKDLEGRPYPSLFWWEGPDGSRVLCWRIPRAYGQSPATTADELEEQVREEAASSFVEGISHAPFFLGVGNHGGGPTRRLIERMRVLQKDPNLPEIRFSTMGQFFRKVRQSRGKDALPVLRQGLQYVDVGCYAAHGRIKRACRGAERSLLKAEAMDSLAGLAGLPRLSMTDNSVTAWRSLLFGQFHDILAGTCIQSTDREIFNLFSSAEQVGAVRFEDALHRVARSIDTSWGKKGMLTLFNPLPWERQAVVSFDTFVNPTADMPIRCLRDHRGRRHPIQWGPPETCFGPMGMEWKKLHAVVSLPAGGYRSFALSGEVSPQASGTFPSATVHTSGAGLSRLGWKGRENLLSEAMCLRVFRDSGDTWGHKLSAYDEELGEPIFRDCGLLVNGPLVQVYRQTFTWKQSTIQIYITLRRGIPHAELKFRINWQEPRELLRVIVPTRFKGADVLVSEPGGQTVRKADGKEKPATEWLALSGTHRGSERAIGIVADRSMSYCCAAGQIGITLARSSFYAHHHPQEVADAEENPYLDMGALSYRLFLLAGPSVDQLSLPNLSWEMDTPAERVMDNAHPGELPPQGSLLQMGPGMALMALKPAEDGNGWILRMHETRGRRARTCLKAGSGKLQCWEAVVEPHEIVTLRLAHRSGKLRAQTASMLERGGKR